ncbi:haloacid dehalogenase-like hydrolase family protein [Tritrichomonas foetus]|uniref:Haloacid dehalogenase-like hydrolase family protein n=1 Tax=Tritrichomonas foetus TaxID=1144522 RepID=A0A1J4K1V6_9EUKA|nr:haloacid dehalogenase-like hydrolase family protein [Tritrichomonas foetus]|eukprot:OHT03726.1 haloacid dehalogenase-like hydrolase family protein [Tritrichomonas foetus]
MLWEHPIKGVVCDIDGLLLDTEPIFVDAMHEATGYPLSHEFHLRLMGRSGFEAAPWIRDEYGLSYSDEEIIDRIDQALKKRLGNAKLFPGAPGLINGFKTRGIPLALATGSNRINFSTKTNPHKEFFDQFDGVTCGDEVSLGKPNPEIFLKSMKKIGIDDPQNILVFEDAPAGVKCANNAGMPVVMVPDPSLDLEKALAEYDAHPTIILKDLSEFDFNCFKFE